MREREQHDAADEEERPGATSSEIQRAEQRLQHREVRREAARELAGAALGEEAGRQPHEVREHVLAQLRDHALGGAGEQVDLHEVHRALQREQRASSPSAMRSSSARSLLLERGVEQVRTTSGNARPTPAATSRQTAQTASRPRVRAEARQRGGRAARARRASRARDDARRGGVSSVGLRHVSALRFPRGAASAAARRATGSSRAPPRSAPRATAAARVARSARERGGALQSRADHTRTCTTPSSHRRRR